MNYRKLLLVAGTATGFILMTVIGYAGTGSVKALQDTAPVSETETEPIVSR